MTCEYCGGQITTRGGKKFCSRTCSGAARRKRLTFTCARCGTSFERRLCEADRAKYCSKACWADRATWYDCERAGCGIAFKITGNGVGRYCSRRCANIDMTGEKASRWIDGKSLERERQRLQPKVRVWRIAVFQRDGHACRICGDDDYIHAHHIKPWATHPESRFDVANGLTVCPDCHSDIHGRTIGQRPRQSDASKNE